MTPAAQATAPARAAMPTIIFAFMRTAILATLLVTCAAPAVAQLDRLTQREALAGLRAALERGSNAAVAALGRADGFLGNPQVKIPLPESLERAEKLARRLGFSNEVDELVVAMNRAAEAAVPEARKLLVDSVKKMTAKDAKGILTGGETAGTAYFKRVANTQLHDRFLPLVRSATEKVGVAQRYRDFAQPAAVSGLIKTEDADLDEYVTQKALDGLYFMLGEEEKKIRKDPIGTGSAILRKVFGAR
jgi:Protein of unknown function (DUF4197)